MTFKHTYPGAAFDADGKHIGPGPWLKVIHEANRLMVEFLGTSEEPAMFGAPTYAADDERHAIEIYPDATVAHDFPSPVGPAYPPDSAFGTREWSDVARERERLRDAWVRDPRNTVTITSKTPLGERLLTAAHAEIAGPHDDPRVCEAEDGS